MYLESNPGEVTGAFHSLTCTCSSDFVSFVSGCTAYGSTFKEEHYYITHNNLHRYITSLDNCLNDCVTKYPTCRMVEYEGVGTVCHITTVTALTNPADVVYWNSANDIQFLRNCE